MKNVRFAGLAGLFLGFVWMGSLGVAWGQMEEGAPAEAAPVQVPTPGAVPDGASANVSNSAPDSAIEAAAPTDDEPVARAQFVPPPHFKVPPPPDSAVVADYIGHRYAEPSETGGWGWVKLATEEGWRKGKARWVAMRETPGQANLPRTVNGRVPDQDFEYRLHGYIAPYQVYDPHTNEMLDVFVLESYQEIGSARPLHLRPGPAERQSGDVPHYVARPMDDNL